MRDGQRSAQEIYQELRYRLICIGYLPDEYFLIDDAWNNGRLYPEDAELSFRVDFGASEGIYLDIDLHYTNEEGNRVKSHFATGKTLGETGSDLDRMYLTASACMKAFHTDGLHARYVTLGEVRQPESMVLHLSSDEKELVIDCLIEMRSRIQVENKPVNPAEQLLRRIIGNITAYMEAVGERPQNISPYDYAILSIRDSNMKGFLESYRKVTSEENGDLLIRAARRPGRIGKKMMELLLMEAKEIPSETFESACKSAINTCDLERVVLLIDKAVSVVKDMDMSMYGRIIQHAQFPEERRGYTGNIAFALIKRCTSEQLSAANPYLLEHFIMFNKSEMAYELIKKGVPHDPDKTMFDVAKSKNVQLFYMLRRQTGEDLSYSGALRLCMRWNNLDAAIFLLRNGIEFEKFRDSIESDSLAQEQITFLGSLTHFWENNIKK